MPLKREDLRVRYQMFDRFALQDQTAYYKRTASRYRAASAQVNQIRALLALLAGLAAAAAALIVQSSFTVPGTLCLADTPPDYCSGQTWLIAIFTIGAVTLPAFAAFFSTLADLFQWDRLVTIYDAALENIVVADAQSPEDEIPDETTYRAALMAYTEGTLSVMTDETAQWGQAIRTPVQLEKYLEEAKQRVEALEKKTKDEGDNG